MHTPPTLTLLHLLLVRPCRYDRLDLDLFIFLFLRPSGAVRPVELLRPGHPAQRRHCMLTAPTLAFQIRLPLNRPRRDSCRAIR